MKTPRSTALAERLIFWLCLITLTLFIGYEVGVRMASKDCKAQPVAKKLSVQDMSKKNMRRWAMYWSRREL